MDRDCTGFHRLVGFSLFAGTPQRCYSARSVQDLKHLENAQDFPRQAYLPKEMLAACTTNNLHAFQLVEKTSNHLNDNRSHTSLTAALVDGRVLPCRACGLPDP
jgi:hypothetical protein